MLHIFAQSEAKTQAMVVMVIWLLENCCYTAKQANINSRKIMAPPDMADVQLLQKLATCSSA